MEYIIATEKITKVYGKLKAVDEVSLGVKQGEIYGFLGLNGAGKTTTIRMLLGMINPSGGVAFIKGKKVYNGEAGLWQDVGYLVEIPYSYPELTVKENLMLFKKLRLMNDFTAVDRVIEKLKLTPYKNVKTAHLSQGNQQRLGIAKALLHSPEILILDEPANGLDPAGIVEIRELLKNLSLNEGRTIFISSHILAEISKLADRIGIIHQGKLIKELDERQLEKERLKRIIVGTNNNEKAYKILVETGYKKIFKREDCLVISDDEAIKKPEKIAIKLVESKNPPFLLRVEEEDLESYFLRIVGGTK